MCGIFACKGNLTNWKDLKPHIAKISYRGPDNSKTIIIDDNLLFGFHRLAIVGTNESGDQPLFHPSDDSLALICNGEIYNYKHLEKKYDFDDFINDRVQNDFEKIVLKKYPSIAKTKKWL